MYFPLVIIATLFGVHFAKVYPGPKFPPTKGAVWPKPQFQRKDGTYYTYVPSQFNFTILNNTCDILNKAVERYSFTLRTFAYISRWSKRSVRTPQPNSRNGTKAKVIKQLEIELTSPCENRPYMGMDESYELTVNQTSYLKANSIWGILKGLESFSHLFYLTDDYTEVRINSTTILDFPRYLHRGLLLDTSRHFISLNKILKTLNAMAMNKMNVLHWHIVDDQSFPYQSEKFPELSAKGAFHPSMVYSKADIETVIRYATYRGIRVVPEFDAPGHTRSWGEAFPNILTQCYEGNKSVSLGPMDPTKNDTYNILRELLNEVQSLFPDEYFHIGGDEVDLNCWLSNPDVIEYIKQHNVTEDQLHGIFMKNVLPLLKPNSTAIVWQEVFDENVSLNKDVLVQVWKSADEMINVLNSGHKVLYSASWYLDHLSEGGDWKSFYDADPRDMLNGKVNWSLLSNIVGGEACMWGEVVDDSNVISRVWPRASAVAERLWSTTSMHPETFLPKLIILDTENRLEEHTCRMKRRGVDAQPPNGAGFCVTSHNE
ncbi:beta-hexosaminidase subunit beta-like [Plodia interpunctella]|uniref:beta-hexosaminidase subunit beta-like n=1 Tax=Plodia interpunctella TaxID=58824 RepID=UPI00236888F5|nr:beta-hexosaminidase subunit beta-like [Plodia interpunctella]